MKGLKRSQYKVVLLLAAMLVFVLAFGMTSQAASQKTKALKAYRTMMSKTYITKDGNKVKTKNCKFAIAYIDNNSVPELVVYNSDDIPHMAGWGMLYTYRNGKVKYVTSLELNVTGGYYKKKGILTDIYSHGYYESTTYIKLKNGKATDVLYKASRYNYDKKKWTVVSHGKYVSGKYKEISKSAFNKALKSYVGSKKPTKFKFYKNTAANRKKYIK